MRKAFYTASTRTSTRRVPNRAVRRAAAPRYFTRHSVEEAARAVEVRATAPARQSSSIAFPLFVAGGGVGWVLPENATPTSRVVVAGVLAVLCGGVGILIERAFE